MARKKRKRAYGMGSVYQRGPGNWWIKWRQGGRIRYARGYPTRELAEQVLTKIAADLAAGRDGLPQDRSGVPPLSDLATEWLERRRLTHRAARHDANRWNRHLKPAFGAGQPDDIDPAAIRAFVEERLATGLNPATVGHCVRLLSSFFTDLVERGLARENPVRKLPRSTRRLYRPTADPRNTPFLANAADVSRAFRILPDPINVAFAVGALAGLRTGEVLGLDWCDIDLLARRINVRRQMQDGRLTPLKDDESRVVPILKPLVPVLVAYKLRTGGVGPLLAAGWNGLRGGRPGRAPTFIRPHTLHRHLRKALKTCKLPLTMTWYHCTRHTFASLWVLGGGSIEKLAVIMGHSSTVVTQRYAHMRPELFRETDYQVIDVDMSPGGEVASIADGAAGPGANGYASATMGSEAEVESAASTEKDSTAPIAQLDRAAAF